MTLEQEVKWLRRLVKAQDKLLFNYRVGGTRGIGTVLDEIRKCRQALEPSEEPSNG